MRPSGHGAVPSAFEGIDLLVQPVHLKPIRRGPNQAGTHRTIQVGENIGIQPLPYRPHRQEQEIPAVVQLALLLGAGGEKPPAIPFVMGIQPLHISHLPPLLQELFGDQGIPA